VQKSASRLVHQRKKRGPCFWFGPRENEGNRRKFVTEVPRIAEADLLSFLDYVETKFKNVRANVDVEIFSNDRHKLSSFLPLPNLDLPACFQEEVRINPVSLTINHVTLYYLREVIRTQKKISTKFVCGPTDRIEL